MFTTIISFAEFSAKNLLVKWYHLGWQVSAEEQRMRGERSWASINKLHENWSSLFKRNVDINWLVYVTPLCNQLYWIFSVYLVMFVQWDSFSCAVKVVCSCILRREARDYYSEDSVGLIFSVITKTIQTCSLGLRPESYSWNYIARWQFAFWHCHVIVM